MRQHVDYLAGQIGARPTGSDPEKAAAAYIAEQFHDAGLVDVAIEPVDVIGFDYSTCHLACPGTAPAMKLSSHPARFCGSTDGTRRLALRYLDSLDDARWDRMAGQCVAFWGACTAEHYIQAVEADVGALLMGPGILGTGHHTGEMDYAFRYSTPFEALAAGRQIPLVTTAYWDLAEAVRQEAGEVELEVDGQTVRKEGYNIVGRLDGGNATRRVVLCAHHDSVAGSPGAGDDAAGVAILIEVADRLRNQRGDVQVDFVSFTAEEVGYMGAHAYSSAHAATLREADLVLYIDGQGDVIGRTILHVTGDEPLRQFVRECVASAGVPAEVRAYVGGLDHSVLMAKHRMPGVWMQRPPQLYWHTRFDGPAAVSEKPMQEGAKIFTEIIRQLDTAEVASLGERLEDATVEGIRAHARQVHPQLTELLA
ncbi:MAG: M28 family metallopeptidase [Phycisphaerae bacterium]